MSYDDEQLRSISDAVKEQLGIEEDEDESLIFIEDPNSLEALNYEIEALKVSVKEKDEYIHKLELKLVDASKRIDLLERMFYDFKEKYKR